jgi:hypothetical protein
LGSIQGIPSASPELTGFITRLHEKIAEESFRSIFKDGAKTAKAAETDDYDVERKTFHDKIKSLENERQRLEKICLDRHIDTHTRKQKNLDKEWSKQPMIPREITRGTGTPRVRPDKARSLETTGVVSTSTATRT